MKGPSPKKENRIQNSGLSIEQRAERYFDLLQENMKLKKDVKEQELNIKK